MAVKKKTLIWMRNEINKTMQMGDYNVGITYWSDL
jgi:hypothetical protein